MIVGTEKLRQDGIIYVWQKYEGDVEEIAKIYGISSQSVYNILKDYCKAKKLVYENFLRQPKKPYEEWNITTIRKYGGTEMITINGKKKFIKNIRTEIKYGATAEDFANYFETTEDIFLEELSKRLGQRFQGYKRQLEQNKKKGRSTSKSKNSGDVEAKSHITEIEPIKTREEELQENILLLMSEIEKLQEEGDEVQRIIEASYIQMDEANIKLAEIQSQLMATKALISSLKEETEKGRETLQHIQRNIEDKQELLKAAEEELETYKEVIVSFSTNGIQISTEGFEPTSDEIEAKNLELSKLGKFDDYALKYTKAAAAVLCAVESLEIMEMRYSIDFDNCILPVKEILAEVLSAA